MTIKENMLQFWNRPTLDEAKVYISSPENWEKETPHHVDLILNGEKNIHRYVVGLPQSSLMVDIGAGVGRLIKEVNLQTGADIAGFDISEKMVSYSQDYLEKVDGCQVSLVQKPDEPEFNLLDNSVDLVYSLIVFQHLPTRELICKYLKESLRVLKVGGMIRVQTHRGLPPPPGEFHGFAGHMYPNIETFAKEFSDVGFKILNTQDGLGHPEWLWVTAVKE